MRLQQAAPRGQHSARQAEAAKRERNSGHACVSLQQCWKVSQTGCVSGVGKADKSPQQCAALCLLEGNTYHACLRDWWISTAHLRKATVRLRC